MPIIVSEILHLQNNIKLHIVSITVFDFWNEFLLKSESR